MLLPLSVFFSSILVILVACEVRRSRRFVTASLVAGPAILFGWPCIFFPALALTSILLLVLIGLCSTSQRVASFFGRGAVAAMLLAHAIVGIGSISQIQEQRELREANPLESMAQRLAYEPMALASRKQPVPVLDKDVLSELENFTGYSGSNMRKFALMQLHENAIMDFVDSPGFGVTRSLRPRRRDLELPAVEPIPLPTHTEEENLSIGEPTHESLPRSGTSAATSVPGFHDLDRLHHASVDDFAYAPGFGYIRDRDHVRGFVSHRFTMMPEFTREPAAVHRWRVENLQLVSLLKHDVPVAYVADNLPRMDELRTATTRPLDSFEQQALPSLQRGESLAIRTSSKRIRMLGAVRAFDQCLKCHHGERGELLGAFSYTLRSQP